MKAKDNFKVLLALSIFDGAELLFVHNG